MTIRKRTLLITAMAASLLAAAFGTSAVPRADRNNDRPGQVEQTSQSQARWAAQRDRKDRDDRREHKNRDDRDDRRDRDDRNDRNDRDNARRRDARTQERYERDRQQHDRNRRAQEQRRIAQYRYEQAYQQRARAEQARRARLNYGYTNNPYRNMSPAYRYNRGGDWYQVNRYGADMLRQAVNRGYDEGLRAGRADRSDRWRADYRNSRAWIDGSYGYDNYYVSRGDYQHYFRQGFQRGYDDGYSSRSRYGHRNSDGTAIILTTVLAAILNLQAVR